MPKDNFWSIGRVEGDAPDLAVRWGDEQEHVTIGNCALDRSGLNRLIETLQTARDRQYGADARASESDLARVLRKAEESADNGDVDRADALTRIASLHKAKAELVLA